MHCCRSCGCAPKAPTVHAPKYPATGATVETGSHGGGFCSLGGPSSAPLLSFLAGIYQDCLPIGSHNRIPPPETSFTPNLEARQVPVSLSSALLCPHSQSAHGKQG